MVVDLLMMISKEKTHEVCLSIINLCVITINL
jgi:hypothetical protein